MLIAVEWSGSHSKRAGLEKHYTSDRAQSLTAKEEKPERVSLLQ